MMKLSEIYAFLNELSPFYLQESWDNSGLLLGSFDDEIKQIYTSLDLDESLIKNAEPNSLFITHHPLIFKGLKDLANDKFPRKFIKEMIKKNLSLISMHTNFDKTHLNAYFVSEILGFKNYTQDEFLIYVDVSLSFKELCALVKEKLKLDVLRVSFAGKEKLSRIAICTGSGADLISNLKNVDCFLSGDFKYHSALEAINNNLSLIDLGHFESEEIFSKSLENLLQKLPLKVIMSVSQNPFQYF